MAKTIKVYAPNCEHTGITAGVAFAGGVAEVEKDRKAAIAYFKRHGYKVEDGKGSKGSAPDSGGSSSGDGGGKAPARSSGAPPKVGAGSGTKEWAKFAESVGVDPADKNRAEIIAAVEAKLEEGSSSGDGEDG